MEIKTIKSAFTDDRGSIYDLLTDDQVDHVGMLTSKKGSIRGKHYHKQQKQYTLLLKGKVKIVSKNILEKESQIETFELNEMEMILFPPNCYHSIEALEDSTLLVFTSKSRSGTGYEDDTFRINDINSLQS